MSTCGYHGKLEREMEQVKTLTLADLYWSTGL